MNARHPRLETRQAHTGDLANLCQLDAACFPDPWPPGALAAELDHPHALVLVVDQDSTVKEASPLAGFACFRRAVDEAELLRLGIGPSHRRQGLGRLLLASGKRFLLAAGTRVLWLEVRVDNHGAVAFYENVGFTSSHRRKSYYSDGCDALIYQRFL